MSRMIAPIAAAAVPRNRSKRPDPRSTEPDPVEPDAEADEHDAERHEPQMRDGWQRGSCEDRGSHAGQRDEEQQLDRVGRTVEQADQGAEDADRGAAADEPTRERDRAR